MSHFYDRNGKLIETDLKTARKLKLVPGTTEVIHEFENSYGLDLYRAKQMFMASLTLPRPAGCTDEEFFELVKKDSQEHSERAKEFGVQVHDIVTRLLNHEQIANTYSLINPAIKSAMKIYEWIKVNKESCIVDFKTQETKNGKFKSPYDSHLFQLCGYYLYFKMCLHADIDKEHIETEFYAGTYGGKIDYAKLFQGKQIKLINLYVSSTEDIPIKVYPWKPEKIEWGTRTFLKMVELYKIIKKLEY